MDAAIFDPPSRITPDNLTGDIWLVQTKWKQEDSLCDELTQAGYSCYVPRQRVKKWYANIGEWRTWEAIIFPGYMFIGDCDRDETQVFYDIFDTERALRQQHVADQKRVISDLRNFEIIYSAGLSDRLQRVTRFRPGDAVRVVSGPLMGLEGYMVRDAKKTKVVISLSCVSEFGVASPRELEIDREHLERQ
jgi:transcription antitermination factor NusG